MTQENGSESPLERVRKGKIVRPLRVLLYGAEGLGKSTFAANAPEPLFLGSEEGTYHIECARIQPRDWNDTLRLVRWFATPEAAPYKTIVLDTLDWFEPMVVQYICRRDDGSVFEGSKKPRHLIVDGKPFIEGYGYGKGWGVAVEEWRTLLSALDKARNVRGAHVIFLSHAHVSKEKNAAGDDYGVIGPNLNKQAVELLVQWSDVVLYGERKKIMLEAADDFNKRAKIVTDGTRIVHTDTIGAHRAKNRYRLPSTMALSWDEVYRAIEKSHEGAAEAKAVRVDIAAKVDELERAGDKDIRARVADFMVKVGDNVPKLLEIGNRLAVLIANTRSKNEEKEKGLS